jgi:hypothetical protein
VDGARERNKLHLKGQIAAVLTRLNKLLWSRQSGPELHNGEGILLEGQVALLQGTIGVRLGPLILTNQRLIWYEPSVARPLKPICGEIALPEIKFADKGNILDLIGGGKRLRLHLHSGKRKTFAESQGRLNEWVEAINSAINEYAEHSAPGSNANST